MFFQYPFDKPESEALNDLYKKSLKIEPKEPKEPREPKNNTRKPLVAVGIIYNFLIYLSYFVRHNSSLSAA